MIERMQALEVISTESVAPRERLPMWGDAVWKLIGGLRSDAFGDEHFAGRIAFGHASDLSLCQLDVTRHRVLRTPGLIRRSDRGFYKVVAQLEGRACFEQHGRAVWLAPGEWSLYDTTEAYAVSNPDSVRQLVLMVPKERLPLGDLPMRELTVQRFSGAAGVSRLAWEAMRSAFDELPGMSTPVQEGVADTVVQLLRLSLLERAGRGTGRTQKEALRDRIREHIARQLRDPRLSVDRIAAALNCSRRHLYNAFADEPEGLAGYVHRERLEATRRALDAASAGESITEIAQAWGWNSLAPFSRAFKARYGCSPSDYREQGQAADRSSADRS